MRFSCINENQPAPYDNGLIMMQMILPRHPPHKPPLQAPPTQPATLEVCEFVSLALLDCWDLVLLARSLSRATT